MNRRFRFRLERLRRVRAIEERVARASWSAAEREAAEAERALAEHRAAIEAARTADRREALDPRRVLVEQEVADGLVRGLLPRKETALTLRGQAARLAAAWRERESDRRALEELETRARSRHRSELERRENREMDETALLRSRLESDSSRARAQTEKGGSGRRPDAPR